MKTTTLRLRAIRWKPNATLDDMALADWDRRVLWHEGERFHFDWHFNRSDWQKRRLWIVDRHAGKTGGVSV